MEICSIIELRPMLQDFYTFVGLVTFILAGAWILYKILVSV